MGSIVDELMQDARPRRDALLRERVADEVRAVLFGRRPTLQIGRFRVESRIGSGGMGIVYLGYDPELERRVAIKVLDLRRVTTEPHRAQQRLIREARALARLTHPNVVSVHELGLLDDGDEAPRLYLVMEHVEGPTLRRWLKHPQPLAHRLELLAGAARGLAACHDAGLVHGDFKPENILVGRDGRARVVDFGLSLPLFEHLEVPTLSDGQRPDESGITLSGVFGTPAYIAPELLAHGRIGARADQFSFCVVACELLYGRRPFIDDDPRGPGRADGSARVQELRDPRIPSAVRDVLARGLAVDPAERFDDMHGLLAGIESAFARRRRRRTVLATGLAATAIGLGLWQLAPGPEEAPSNCPSAEVELAEVWSPAHRQAIVTQLGPRNPDALATTLEVLDEYGESWSAGWSRACSMPSDDASRGRMQSCLEARRLGLQAVVGALGSRESPVVAPLSRLDGLDPIEPCLELDSLDRLRPVPIEAEARDEVERIRNELLVPTHLALELEHPQEALAKSEEALRRAKALGFRPLEAETALARAQALADFDRTDEAVAMAEQAHLTALAAIHLPVLIEAALLRVQLTARQADLETGWSWMTRAEAAVEAAGGGAERMVQLRTAGCILAMAGGTESRAIDECQRAQGLIDEGAPVDLTVRSTVLTNLAVAELLDGRLREADEHFERARRAALDSHGPDHTIMATIDINWGHVAYARGRYELALERYLRAREHFARKGVPDDGALVSVADALAELGRLVEATAAYEQSIPEAVSRGDYWSEHAARNGLGRVALARGDTAGALEIWSAQLEQARAQLEPSHPWRTDLEMNVGHAEVLLGRVDEGMARMDAAIASLEQSFGRDHVELTDDLWTRGQSAREVGRWTRCADDLGRVAELERRNEAAPATIAAAEVERVLCLVEEGTTDVETLVAELERALTVLEAGPDRSLEAMGRLALGRARLRLGRRPEAEAELSRARALLVADVRDHARDVARIDAWLAQP